MVPDSSQPDHDRLEAIFIAALDIAGEVARRKYVQQACGNDAALMARVEELIANHLLAGSFLGSSDLPQYGSDRIEDFPDSQIGQYQLLKRIGQGGMGVVFLAEQTAPFQRQVAVKVIRAGMDSAQVVARFEQERQALALMNHPNIAKVIDGGLTPDGRPYFAMELIEGLPITQYCDQFQLTPRQRLDLFRPVCEAIQHAHQKGIIHRDLKPSNVLVTETEGKPTAKVIDFGVAKAIGTRLAAETLHTHLGSIIGTLEYMSPEQAVPDQDDVDTRSDIYCLGVLLFELLTGTTPLQRQNLKNAAVHELLRFICEEETPKPSDRLSAIQDLTAIAASRGVEPKALEHALKGDLDWIVMKCLEKDRNRRYASASAVARDIERFLSDEPVEAGPPGTTYRMRKFLWRNRWALTVASLLLLTMVVGIIGTTIGMIQAARGRADARDALVISEKQRVRAERHYQRAMSAVDRLLTHVGEVRLESVPLMDQTRLRLLQDALDFYREMLQEEDDDPVARRELGLAWRRVGDLQSRLGDKQAEDSFKRAIEIQQQLLKERPDDDHTNHDYVKSQRYLGYELFRCGRLPEAGQIASELLSRQSFTTDEAISEQSLLLYLQGSIYSATRKSDEAILAFKEGLALTDSLVRSNPSRTEYQLSRANVLNRLGSEYRVRRSWEEAERYYEDSRAAMDQLLTIEPDNPTAKLRLAVVYNNLGLLFSNRDRPTDAMAANQKAISLFSALDRDHPGLPDYKWLLARSLNNTALFHSRSGDPAQAAAENEKVVLIFKELMNSFPQRLDFMESYASSCGNQGKYLGELDRHEESISWNTKAIEGTEQLLAIEPNHTESRLTLHGNLIGRAGSYRQLGKMELALPDYHRSLELSQGESHADYVNFRPRALAFVGEHQQAAAAADAIVSSPTATAFNFSEMAKVHATCAQAASQDANLNEQQRRELSERYAARCVELLSQASTKGRFPTLEHVSDLRADDRLTLIKDREDFQKLCSEIEQKLKATPP